ncbi:MAG: HD domain-containing protein [Bacteroidota bacterium]
MPANLFTNIKVAVCEKLKGLDPNLTYHNLLHTLDVLHQSERIAEKEGIRDAEEIYLLRIAALYHDTGFLETYAEHEKTSCSIFLKDADTFGLTQNQKDKVMALIMATRIPQNPTTLLERIICDADLDYLGRDDFFDIGDTLRQEFLYYHVLENNAEWEKVQLKFLQSHRYHTATSRVNREPVKQMHYTMLLGNNHQG